MVPEGARVGHCGADSCVLLGSVPATRHHNLLVHQHWSLSLYIFMLRVTRLPDA